MDKNDERAQNITKFMEVLGLQNDYLFGDAIYATNKNRNEKLRKLEKLPLTDDIIKIRKYIDARMKELISDSFVMIDVHFYTELRDLVVCRLTLFNARRGGEPCRLQIKEWVEAEENAWINENEIDRLENSIDIRLAKSMKITYQTGKGNKHLVPVILPNDTIEPLRKLVSAEVRCTADVAKANPYVFASTSLSMSHVSGWHAVHNVCK